MKEPFQLLPIFRERLWGRDSLAPLFETHATPEKVGEVWFSFEENATSLGVSLGELIAEHPEVLGSAADLARPGVCPLLMKLLFTSERLSVQVHPDDEYAERHHESLGKTEAWYVVDAHGAAELAVGFRETVSADRMKDAVASGEIETLLHWVKVKAEDTIFVPAGTVHAIGEGLVICEIQQNSDITYRLYDYGRERELHLQHGLAVAQLCKHEGEVKPKRLSEGRDELLGCPYFRIERLRSKTGLSIDGGLPYYLLILCLKGSGTIAGQAFSAGQAWMVPAQNTRVDVDGKDCEWIVAYSAKEAANGINVRTL